MPKAVVVIPCFNEAARFQAAGFEALGASGQLDVLFVDDGSTDNTGQIVDVFCAAHGSGFQALHLRSNVGKGEAVRRGVLTALERNPVIVGYADADLSAPPAEILRLLSISGASPAGVEAVIGSRVRMLGAVIDRRALRHYAGRIFATVASMLLNLPVYDTQCGVKFFRDTPSLRAALAEPFLSRWIFDVELLGRLTIGADAAARERVIEAPLRRWRDVPGSKIRPGHWPRVAVDLMRIAADFKRRKQNRGDNSSSAILS